jgi:hypothetical protein
MRNLSIRGLILSLVLLSFTGLRSGTEAAPAVQQVGLAVPNLVSYWPLDETSGTAAVDAAGANDGTHMGNTLPTISATVAPVPVGNQRSVLFDATIVNQRIEVPDNNTLDITGPLTLACWARVTANTVNQMGLIEHWSGTDGTINGYFLRLGYRLDAGTMTDQQEPKFAIGNGTTQPEAVAMGTYVPLNTWFHIAGVFDGTNLQVYLDAASLATTAAGGVSPTIAASPLHLGVDYGANRLNGHIDDPRIYNRALSTNEINVLMTGQPPVTGFGAVAGPGSATLNWTEPAAVANVTVTYTIQRSTDNLNWTTITTGLPYGTTSYVAGGLVPGQNYYFRIFVITVMESVPASAGPVVPTVRVPSDNDEGLWGDKCSCGSSIPVAPGALFGAAAIASILLLALRRR